MKKNLHNRKLHFEDLPKRVRGALPRLKNHGKIKISAKAGGFGTSNKPSIKGWLVALKYYIVQIAGFFYILYLKGIFLYRRLDKRFRRPVTLKEAIAIGLIVWLLWPSHHAIGIEQPQGIKMPQIVSKWPQTDKQPQNEAVYLANRPEVLYPTKDSYSIPRTNNYTFGNCTWYVASVLPVPDGWHDADYWDDAAKNAGYLVSSTPKVGSIAQTDNYGRGHVAIVIAVYSANSFRVREMNFNGFDRVDERNADLNDFQHFIYL